MDLKKLQDELPRSKKIARGTIEKQNFVVFCDPSRPLYSLEALLGLISESYKLCVSVHTHSSVASLPQELNQFCLNLKNLTGAESADVTIAIVWKVVGIDAVLRIGQNREIIGEVNIARYLNRLIEAKSEKTLRYETDSVEYADKIDAALDRIHAVIHGATNINLDTINSKHKTRYILGDNISVVDIVWNSVKKCRSK